MKMGKIDKNDRQEKVKRGWWDLYTILFLLKVILNPLLSIEMFRKISGNPRLFIVE